MLPEEKLNLLKKYFFQQTVKKDLDELQLVREIETAGDIITMLTTLLNLFVFRDAAIEAPVYWKLFLWIDEVEDLSALPGKEQTMFTNFLRDILDAVPNHLTIFINFTLRPTEEYEDLGILLRDAVMSRIRKEIHFEELDQPHVHRYIQELLTHPKYRPDDLKEQCPDPGNFPFDSESLAYLSSVLSGQTPRLINEACTLLIERALIEGVFEKPENRIDRAFIEKHESIIPPAQKVPRSDR